MRRIQPLTLDTLLESNAARRAHTRNLKEKPGNKARIQTHKHLQDDGYPTHLAPRKKNKTREQDSSFEAQGPSRDHDMHIDNIRAHATERRAKLREKNRIPKKELVGMKNKLKTRLRRGESGEVVGNVGRNLVKHRKKAGAPTPPSPESRERSARDNAGNRALGNR